MFPTGFYMNPDEIADRNGETLIWMKEFAKEKEIVNKNNIIILYIINLEH